MSLELRDVNGDPIPVANLTEPISLFVATGQTPSVPSLVTLSHRAFVYHMLTIDKNDTSIHFEINPQDPNTEIIAYLKRGARPTREDYDFMQVVPDEPPINATYPKDRHMFYVSNGDTNRTTAGTWYLGVFYNGTLSPQFKLNSANVPKLFIPKKVNYTLRMYSSGCLFWDKENDKWSGDGCVVNIVFNVLRFVFIILATEIAFKVYQFEMYKFVLKENELVFIDDQFVFKFVTFSNLNMEHNFLRANSAR